MKSGITKMQTGTKKSLSHKEANAELRKKAKELEKKTYALGKANVQLLAMQEALQESEERFRNLVENANDTIYTVTFDSELSYVSPNWTNLLGHEVSEVIGKPIAEFLHPDDLPRCQAFLQKMLDTGEKQSGIEYRVKHKNGEWQWHRSNASILRDARGKMLCFMGIARDITERRRFLEELEKTNRHLRETQAKLVQSEKMAALGNLVAGIAHEINSPVGAIHSMHDTLARAVEKLRSLLRQACSEEFARNKKMHAALRAIDNSNRVIEIASDRVSNIVKRLKSFARLDEAELDFVDLHEGIEDTLMLVNHLTEKRISVKKNYASLPMIACFPRRLNQVFLNLIVNACQAIKEAGEVRITTAFKSDKVYVEFEDDGVGIPPGMIAKIFDPGFTTKGVGVGVGLGLSICYRIIQDHKGEILVSSETDKGTKFTVVLPTNLDEILTR